MKSNSPIKSSFIRIYLSKFRKSNCIYHSDELSIPSTIKSVSFLLNNSKFNHYGDILFYIPLIIYLSRYMTCNIISCKSQYKFLEFFFGKNVNINLFDKSDQTLRHELIITMPYLLYYNKGYHNKLIGLGLPTQPINESYPLYLSKQIFYKLKLEFSLQGYHNILKQMSKQSYQSKLRDNNILDKDESYIAVSPYLASGKFRDLFKLKKNKILTESMKAADKTKSKLLLLGSSDDPEITSDNIKDLRGIEMPNLLAIMTCKNVIAGYGFDNIWMHYFDLIGKDYFTLYRGRYMPLNNYIHYNSINISFLSDKKSKNYIH